MSHIKISTGVVASYYLPLLPIEIATDIAGWLSASEAVVGYRHRMNEQVCQDAALAAGDIRPVLVLCDGAGSAKVSELGAKALTVGLLRLLTSTELLLQAWLDKPAVSAAFIEQQMTSLIARHAKGLLSDLSQQAQRDINDYRATLLLAVVGTYNTYWCQIGDGHLLTKVKHTGQWRQVSIPEKGEFANQTCFVGKDLHLAQIKRGVMRTNDIEGIVAMSDGAGDKLVCQQSYQVANMVERLHSELAEKQTLSKTLLSFLSDPNVWNSTMGDDKSIALLTRVDR